MSITKNVQAAPCRRAIACARIVAAGLLGLGACSEPQASDVGTRLGQEAAGPAAPPAAEVKTSGTGCPPGTADTQVSPDGLVFTTNFSGYQLQVSPSVDLSVRECALDIALRVPAGRTYAVQSFSYAGYALLQEGVIGRHTASYHFAGDPVPSLESNRTELTGPFEDSYLFTDEVSEEQLVWTGCGVERKLQVATRVQLFNDNARRSGFMTLAASDGPARTVVKLVSRPCNEGSQTTEQLTKASQIVVTPATIRRDEPFSVTWAAPESNGAASYRVQVRMPVSFGDALVWESPEIIGTSVKYGGPPLPLAGLYDVLVIARRAGQEQASDRVRLEVRDGAPAALAKPTGLRVQPSPIQRDQPFVVSWTRGGTSATTILYRVEVRERRGNDIVVVASSPETSSALAAFEPSILPKTGSYQVVVLARDGMLEAASDPLTVQVVDAGATDPAAALLGRYAMRVQTFWQTGERTRPVRELYLAEFVRAGADIELRTRVCSQEAVTSLTSLAIVSPEAVPTFRRKVTLEGATWRTDAEPVGVGYLRSGVPSCAGRADQSVEKDSAQRWIRGSTCRCPRSPSTVPKFDDCRVVDLDGDGQPGVTYELQSGSRVLWNEYFAGVVRSHPVRGTIDARGAHGAQWEIDEVPYKLGCSASLCETAIVNTDQPCASSTNRAEFVPLREPPVGQPEWSCATLRSSQSRLFPQPLLSAPARCQVGSVTDPTR